MKGHFDTAIELRFIETFVQKSLQDRYRMLLHGKRREKALYELLNCSRYIEACRQDVTDTIDTVVARLEGSPRGRKDWYVMTVDTETDGLWLPLRQAIQELEYSPGGLVIAEDIRVALLIGEDGLWRWLLQAD